MRILSTAQYHRLVNAERNYEEWQHLSEKNYGPRSTDADVVAARGALKAAVRELDAAKGAIVKLSAQKRALFAALAQLGVPVIEI